MIKKITKIIEILFISCASFFFGAGLIIGLNLLVMGIIYKIEANNHYKNLDNQKIEILKRTEYYK
jgi:hypothetical protein